MRKASVDEILKTPFNAHKRKALVVNSTPIFFHSRLATTPKTAEMMLFSLIVLQNAYRVSAQGANATGTVAFVQEDNQRDTISLLISCLATLALCVYSAVHLNVPRKGEHQFRTLLRELQWCVIGLFAPELILYTAWRQLASARQLCAEMNKARRGVCAEAVEHDKVCGVLSSPRAGLMFLGYLSDRRRYSAASQRESLDALTWLLRRDGRICN